jgi:hypothetical protein
MFLSTPFSHIFRPRFLLNVREQISDPYHATGKIAVLRYTETVYIRMKILCLGDRASLNSNGEEMPTRCSNGGLLILNIINIFSTCFGCLYTHHQEARSCCCQWCCVLVVAVMVPVRRVLRCVHCYEDVARVTVHL